MALGPGELGVIIFKSNISGENHEIRIVVHFIEGRVSEIVDRILRQVGSVIINSPVGAGGLKHTEQGAKLAAVHLRGVFLTT